MTANRPLVAALVALAGSGLAFAVVRFADFVNPIDRALPFWALLAGLAGAVALREIAAQRIALALPLLLGAAVAIPMEASRHLAYGVLVAAALALALIDAAREGAVSRGRGVALALLLVATRAFPFEVSALPSLLLLGAGITALVVAVGRHYPTSREAIGSAVPLVSLFLIGALALVTPLAPRDAALIPFTLALALFAAGESGPLLSVRAIAVAAISLVLALVVGKWMAAAVAVIVVSRFLVSAVKSYPLRAWSPFLAGALLIGLALFARPHPAVLLVLSALLVVSLPYRSTAASVVPGALLFGAVALTPWSGAVAAAFPLFVERGLWIPVAIAFVIASALAPRDDARGSVRAIGASLLAAAAAIALLPVLPKEPYHIEPVGIAIAPGESFVLEPPFATDAIEVVIAGANISDLAASTPLGRLDAVDDRGEAFARPLATGDLADWGAFRSGDLFGTRNPLPARPAWKIDGAGRTAALRGEGRIRVRLDRPIGRMIVAADPSLPAGARLLVERMEMSAP